MSKAPCLPEENASCDEISGEMNTKFTDRGKRRFSLESNVKFCS